VDPRERGKGEPRLHARAVSRERLVRVLAYVRELEDLLDVLVHLPRPQAKEQRVHAGVLASRQVRLEPAPELEDARDASLDLGRSGRRAELAREELERRA